MDFLKATFIAVSSLFFTTPSYCIDGYEINNGSLLTITEHSICQQVSNNTGFSLFVPTKTSLEWNSFINNTPASVTLGGCTVWGGPGTPACYVTAPTPLCAGNVAPTGNACSPQGSICYVNVAGACGKGGTGTGTPYTCN